MTRRATSRAMSDADQSIWRKSRRPRPPGMRHPLRLFTEQLGASRSPLLDTEPEAVQELQQLYELDIANRKPGVDLRPRAYEIAHSNVTCERLRQSDELAAALPGHVSLRRKRRLGILRYLRTEASQMGLPIFAPPPPSPRPNPRTWPDLDIHWGAYLDELEWEPYWIVRTGYGWRPTFATMNSFAMRGVLWLRASYFYYANTNLLIPGRLLPDTKYDTETVMRWAFRQGYRITGQREHR